VYVVNCLKGIPFLRTRLIFRRVLVIREALILEKAQILAVVLSLDAFLLRTLLSYWYVIFRR
jgi:hypothetical protein